MQLPQFAFAGKSNVGKSSLINTLVERRKLAHVSNSPGRTRLLNFYRINGEFHLVDLPGYGFARVSHQERDTWRKMVSGYIERNPHLRVVVTLFDIRREISQEDFDLLGWLAHQSIPFVAVLTKADKLSRSRQAQALAAACRQLAPYHPVSVQLFSTISRTGREELLETLGGFLQSNLSEETRTKETP